MRDRRWPVLEDLSDAVGGRDLPPTGVFFFV